MENKGFIIFIRKTVDRGTELLSILSKCSINELGI
jgi:hypothetical protein